MNETVTEAIGWAAAIILLATITRQVYTQWRDHTYKGVSRWLFIGQFAASLGFVVYSYLLGNWVFVATNTLLVFTALAGQFIDRANRKRAQNKRG